ncbi:hypothetical protein ACQZV8_14255, partial [Magnetococcales bacterium HHB-1]
KDYRTTHRIESLLEEADQYGLDTFDDELPGGLMDGLENLFDEEMLDTLISELNTYFPYESPDKIPDEILSKQMRAIIMDNMGDLQNAMPPPLFDGIVNRIVEQVINRIRTDYI